LWPLGVTLSSTIHVTGYGSRLKAGTTQSTLKRIR
jgi:hypothetical protein